MANTLYDYCRQRFLESQINWMTDTVKVILVSTSAYTPQTAVHKYLADIPVSARIAGPVTLTAKATTGGAADASDCTFTSVSGATINAIRSLASKTTPPTSSDRSNGAGRERIAGPSPHRSGSANEANASTWDRPIVATVRIRRGAR